MTNAGRSCSSSIRLLAVSLCTLLLALGLASCGKEKGKEEAAATGGVEAGAIAWMTSYETALRAAGDKGRPVMIDFYTDWCGWCKKLDAETYVDGQVVAAAGDFVSLKLNADNERQVAARYNITGFPTILFVDSRGNELHRVVGYRPAQAFLGEMAAALAAFKGKS
jgi:thiol:disulfide interchange protein